MPICPLKHSNYRRYNKITWKNAVQQKRRKMEARLFIRFRYYGNRSIFFQDSIPDVAHLLYTKDAAGGV